MSGDLPPLRWTELDVAALRSWVQTDAATTVAVAVAVAVTDSPQACWARATPRVCFMADEAGR